MSTYVVPVLIAPAAAVAVWWSAAAISTPESNSEWLVLFALAPLISAAVWTSVRTRSVVRTAVIGLAMVISTLLVWLLVLLLLFLIAGWSCTDNSYECPV
jgi:hypothetical protein